MSGEHPGLLGFLSEATEIKEELGISFEEAMELQRERADQRHREYREAQQSNVIQFRAKH
jgi:hypothetical protein